MSNSWIFKCKNQFSVKQELNELISELEMKEKPESGSEILLKLDKEHKN